jgi:hypothetical protein
MWWARSLVEWARNLGATQMTFTINLSLEQQRRLSAKAAQAGHELSAYVHQLIDRDLETESLDAILAPVRRNFDQSGS